MSGNRSLRAGLVLALALGAVAVGADAAGPQVGGSCERISGGRTTIKWYPGTLCLGCSTARLGRAIDVSLGTAAEAFFAATGPEGVSLRATAQRGVVYPGGNVAGVLARWYWVDPETIETEVSGVVQVRTYLGGTLQEVVFAGPSVLDLQPFGPPVFIGGSTLKPFDAVELNFIRDAEPAHTHLYVYGFCGDSA